KLETAQGEMLAVAGVTPRLQGGEVRGFDVHLRLVGTDAVHLAHEAADVGDVLDDVAADHPLKRVRLEGPGHHLEVMDDIHAREGSAIDPEAAGRFTG